MVERILLLLKTNRMTAKELTRILEINRSSVSEWKSGKIKPSIEVLIRISRIFNVDLDWLLTGEGTMDRDASLAPLSDALLTMDERLLLENYRDLPDAKRYELLRSIFRIVDTDIPATTKETKAQQTLPESKQPNFALPATKHQPSPASSVMPALEPAYEKPWGTTTLMVYDTPSAAGTGSLLDKEVPYTELTFETSIVPQGADYGVRIQGDSMEPRILDGDVVFVKEQAYLENGQIGIFILDDQAYCKVYHLPQTPHTKKPSTPVLKSLNSKYKDIVPDNHLSFRIVGRVLLPNGKFF